MKNPVQIKHIEDFTAMLHECEDGADFGNLLAAMIKAVPILKQKWIDRAGWDIETVEIIVKNALNDWSL